MPATDGWRYEKFNSKAVMPSKHFPVATKGSIFNSLSRTLVKGLINLST